MCGDPSQPHCAASHPCTCNRNHPPLLNTWPLPLPCSCVRALQGHGMKVLGDAVLNHRCAHFQGEGGKWNRFGGKLAWDERAIVGER